MTATSISTSGNDSHLVQRLHVVNGHHYALKVWLRDMYRDGIMRDGNLTLLHIDSHPDLAFPQRLTQAMCRDWIYGDGSSGSNTKRSRRRGLESVDNLHVWHSMSGAARDNIMISSFVWPMVYCGRVSRIIWIRNPWSTQISDGVKRFHIGNVAGRGDSVRCVGCDDIYFGSFVATGSFSLTKESQKPITLEVHHLNDLLAEGGSDSTDRISERLQLDPERTLLDIDLDWFSTDNPAHSYLHTTEDFHDLIDENALHELSKLFRCESFCLNAELFEELRELQHSNNDRLKDHYLRYLEHRLDSAWHKSSQGNRGPSSIPDMIPSDREEPWQSRLKMRLLMKIFIRYRSNFRNMMLDMTMDQYMERVVGVASPLWCHESTSVAEFISLCRTLRELYEALEGMGQSSASFSRYMSSSVNVPHHVSDDKTIVAMGEQLRTFLSRSGLFGPGEDGKRRSPLVTTIARSENDEHTPLHQRRGIERILHTILHDVATGKRSPLSMQRLSNNSPGSE